LSLFVFAIYIRDVTAHLRNSCYNIRIGLAFKGRLLYADDIVLIFCRHYGL